MAVLCRHHGPAGGHSHNHDVSDMSSRRLFWTIALNVAITLAEAIGGWISGYLALLADAVHNLSDVAALVLAWLGLKGARLPATKTSTFGYKRVEVLTALISAVSLVVIAIFILLEAWERYINPVEIRQPVLFLTVATIGLLGNLFSVWFLASERGKSLNMKTAFLHMLYDTLSSVVVLGGGIVILATEFYALDTILSAAIALMIFWSSYLVIKEAVMIFLEAVPPGIDFDEVHAAIASVDRVVDVHDLHIWSLSSNEAALSCHVAVAADDYAEGPAIICSINEKLHERFRIDHPTIQLELEGCPRPDLLCNNNNQHGRREHEQDH